MAAPRRASPETLERVRRALFAVMGITRAAMREAFASHGLTLPQALCLLFIAKGKARTAGDLATELGVTPGNITGILDRLELQGLVARKPNPDDRRTVALAITAKGKRLVRELESAGARGLDAGLGRLSAAELERLTELLERLIPAPALAAGSRRERA